MCSQQTAYCRGARGHAIVHGYAPGGVVYLKWPERVETTVRVAAIGEQKIRADAVVAQNQTIFGVGDSESAGRGALDFAARRDSAYARHVSAHIIAIEILPPKLVCALQTGGGGGVGNKFLIAFESLHRVELHGRISVGDCGRHGGAEYTFPEARYHDLIVAALIIEINVEDAVELLHHTDFRDEMCVECAGELRDARLVAGHIGAHAYGEMVSFVVCQIPHTAYRQQNVVALSIAHVRGECTVPPCVVQTRFQFSAVPYGRETQQAVRIPYRHRPCRGCQRGVIPVKQISIKSRGCPVNCLDFGEDIRSRISRFRQITLVKKRCVIAAMEDKVAVPCYIRAPLRTELSVFYAFVSEAYEIPVCLVVGVVDYYLCIRASCDCQRARHCIAGLLHISRESISERIPCVRLRFGIEVCEPGTDSAVGCGELGVYAVEGICIEGVVVRVGERAAEVGPAVDALHKPSATAARASRVALAQARQKAVGPEAHIDFHAVEVRAGYAYLGPRLRCVAEIGCEEVRELVGEIGDGFNRRGKALCRAAYVDVDAITHDEPSVHAHRYAVAVGGIAYLKTRLLDAEKTVYKIPRAVHVYKRSGIASCREVPLYVINIEQIHHRASPPRADCAATE